VTHDLKDAGTHFRFGRNWADFPASITEDRVVRAASSLSRLLPAQHLEGRDVIDIGSGSGLSAVAALRLGARHVTAIDIDADSVETSRAVLSRFAPASIFTVRLANVFDPMPDRTRDFDVVHSWGVLHHTGDLARALSIAADLVRPNGTLALALYRRTAIDGFWRAEKRLYAHGPLWVQTAIRAIFKAGFVAALLTTARDPIRYVREYQVERGMSWSHDVHDWLGGYPYESIEAPELIEALAAHGLVLDLSIERPVAAGGLFGVPCNEYRFVRAGAET
jgi:2-polyprenyl-6-hydroxyphenyl methylase/3-demethylubiquinone-9 3-methyltransferase